MSAVRNPHHVAAVASWAQQRAAAFDAWLQEPEQAAQAVVTFDQIRAGFPGVADPVTGSAPMTDGSIAAALAVLGYVVEP